MSYSISNFASCVVARRLSSAALSTAYLAGFVAFGCAINAPSVNAETTVASPLSSHMVLQREKAILVSGFDDPFTEVRLTVGSSAYSTKSDNDGAWNLVIPGQPAGGPFDLKVHGSTSMNFNDLLFGDVWLCSGQSNMEWTIEQTSATAEKTSHVDSKLRLLTIPRRISLFPRARLDSNETWAQATPDVMSQFSAVCYYFGRELSQSLNVPIGVIASSWGGTIIESWLPLDANPMPSRLRAQADKLVRYAQDPARGRARLLAAEDAWWQSFHGESNQANSANFAWQPIDSALPFNGLELAEFDGSAWFKAEFLVGSRNVGQSMYLNLGCVDDRDTTWINGIEVGRAYKWAVSRRYKFSAGIVRPGRNDVLIRVLDTGGDGGFVKCSGDQRPHVEVPLGPSIELTNWAYAGGRSLLDVDAPPEIPYEQNQRAVGVLFNGMIAPLTKLPISGVAWYQGESNTGKAEEYEQYLKLLLTSWRDEFSLELPFLIVQLAAYKDPNNRDWPTLRQAQQNVVDSDSNSRLVVTIDIGDRNDIHPKNKLDVGRRLSDAALNLVYGDDYAPLSPVARAITHINEGVLITFDSAGAGLVTTDGTQFVELEFCSDSGNVCQLLKARLRDGNVLFAECPVGRAGSIRYAWSNFPTVQLFSSNGLPVAPFSFDVTTNSDSPPVSRIAGLKARLETPSTNDVLVVAHRTCWRNTAENSLAGIERCVDVGVDVIEIDVRQSADGELVLLHDETVDRTTNGIGHVADLTLEKLRALRLRSGAGGPDATLTDEQIPTLREALIAAKDRLLVNLDIKEEHYDRALAIARSVGSEDQIIIKMRAPADDPILRSAAFHGQTYFMPIIRECTVDPIRGCTEDLSEAIPTYATYNPIAIEIVNHTDEYLLDGIPAARDMGVRVWVNTLGPRFAAGRSDDKSITDPDNNWGYLVDHGVDMIQTDRPLALIQYLEAKGARRASQ